MPEAPTKRHQIGHATVVRWTAILGPAAFSNSNVHSQEQADAEGANSNNAGTDGNRWLAMALAAGAAMAADCGSTRSLSA